MILNQYDEKFFNLLMERVDAKDLTFQDMKFQLILCQIIFGVDLEAKLNINNRMKMQELFAQFYKNAQEQILFQRYQTRQRL